jgi:hypothetical protein
MSHAFHEGLPGYDPGSIWHDGCYECELRAADPVQGLHILDAGNALRAWTDMLALRWHGGGGLDRRVSRCDALLFDALYQVAVWLERSGMSPGLVEAHLRAAGERAEHGVWGLVS